MIFTFSIMTLIFALIVFIYCHKNSFAFETEKILYPVIGAFIFSLYIAIKSVWFEAPDSIKKDFNLAIYHNYSNCTFSSLYLSSANTHFYNGMFNGLLNIEGAKNDANARCSEYLKNLVIQDRKEIGSANDKSDSFFLDIIELAILRDIDFFDTYKGTFDKVVFNGLLGTTSAGVTKLIYPSVAITNDENMFLKGYTQQVRLPEGSIVEFGRFDSLRRIKIKTADSILKITISQSGKEHIDPQKIIDPKGFSILKHLVKNNLSFGENDSAYFKYYRVHLEYENNKFTRFSKRAKLEMIWLNNLSDNLENSFSWNKLRSTF